MKNVSRRTFVKFSAYGAGLAFLPSSLTFAASAKLPQFPIGNYEAPGLFNQALQEVVTDRDDGHHNDGNPRHYEWWYFDMFTDDGIKVVVSLFSRPPVMLDNPNIPPTLLVNVELPDGTVRDLMVPLPGEKLIAAEDHCDVKLGKSWCKGRYPNWQVHAEHDDVVVDFDLVATMESWRAGSGAMYFNEDLTMLNAHVVPAPRAKVNGSVQVAGKTTTFENGHGYHDHNYGNVGLTVLEAWHWGRAECGDFSLNFSYIKHNADYGNKIVCKFMMAKGHDILLSSGDFEDSFVGEIHVAPQSGNGWPDGFLIEAPYNGDMIRIEISGNHLLSDQLNHPEPPTDETAQPGYVRLAGDIKMTVPLKNGTEVATGTIIHEMAFLEPIPKAEADWLK